MSANLRWFTGLCLLVGCARGSAVPTSDAPAAIDVTSLGGDESDARGGPSGASSGSASQANAGAAHDAGGQTGFDDDAGILAGEVDSGSAGDCAPPLSCEQAQAAGMPNLGSVEWSQTDLVARKTESGSHWYLVTVTGDSASQVVHGGVEAKLSSATGSNYDLFMYGGADGFDHGLGTCEAPSKASEASAAQSTAAAGMTDTAYIAWSAGAFGALSERVVTIEVRHIEGQCADFTLELHGALK